jgi:hypothetical protein
LQQQCPFACLHILLLSHSSMFIFFTSLRMHTKWKNQVWMTPRQHSNQILYNQKFLL